MRGLRVRWNIWNLYIHLCWQTVEQQFIPALAIASAVSCYIITTQRHMKILDKLYFYFYWCWNIEKGKELKDATLEKIIMFILLSIIFIILSFLLSLLKVELMFRWQFLISAIISFFLSRQFIKKYYTKERIQNILNKNDKPGNVKYLVFVLVLFVTTGLIFLTFFLSNKMYPQLLWS